MRQQWWAMHRRRPPIRPVFCASRKLAGLGARRGPDRGTSIIPAPHPAVESLTGAHGLQSRLPHTRRNAVFWLPRPRLRRCVQQAESGSARSRACIADNSFSLCRHLAVRSQLPELPAGQSRRPVPHSPPRIQTILGFQPTPGAMRRMLIELRHVFQTGGRGEDRRAALTSDARFHLTSRDAPRAASAGCGQLVSLARLRWRIPYWR